METEPTDEELRAFVSAMLANLDKSIREPAAIEDAIARHRAMWVALYRASSGFDTPGV